MDEKTGERWMELRSNLSEQNPTHEVAENYTHDIARHTHPGAFTTSFTLRNPIPTVGAIHRRDGINTVSAAVAIDSASNQMTSSILEATNGDKSGDYELMELLHKELVNGTENKDLSLDDGLYENSHIVLLDGVIYEDNEIMNLSPPSKRQRSNDDNSSSMPINIQSSRSSSNQDFSGNFYSDRVEHLNDENGCKSVKKRKRTSMENVSASDDISTPLVGNNIRGDALVNDEDDDDEGGYYDDEDASSVRTGYSTSNLTSLLTTTSSIDNTESSSHSNLSSHLSHLSSTIHSGSNDDEDDDDDEIQSNNTSQAVQPVKRRHRKYYDRRVKPFPRVLKRDIRRSYANMLINVMNSYDVELIVKFFTHFCLANCYLFDDSSEAMQIQPNSMLSALNGQMGAMNGANFPSVGGGGFRNDNMSLRQVQGPEHIALHMLRGMDLVPDCVVRLKQASIHQYLNTTGSKIVCKVTMSGTKLFKYAFTSGSVMLQSILHQAAAQEQVYNVLQMVLGESAAAKLSMEDISQYFQKIMVSEPVDVSFAATITMYLDEEHRIYRLDFTN